LRGLEVCGMTELSHRDKSHTGGSDCAALNPSGKDVPKKDREDLLKGLAMDREDLLTDEGLADSRYKGKSEELWKDLHAAAEWEVR
jgi:hypothetical protein